MIKLKLASITMLLAGATAVPAFAQDGVRSASGEASVQSTATKGPAREEAQEAREDRRENRAGNRDDRRDARAETRDDRRDARAETRDDRREVRDGNRDQRFDVRDAYRDFRAEARGDNRQGSRTWVPGDSRQDPRGAQRDNAAVQHRDDDRDDRRDYDRDRDGSRGDRGRDIDWRNEWRNDRHDWRSDQRRTGSHYTRYRDTRWSGYNWYPQYRYRATTRYIHPYGYRPYRWTVGYRMPYSYYSPRAYWLDWRMYRLPMPPYGYQWVRVDRDVVLVHMGSGYVRDVLYGVFY